MSDKRRAPVKDSNESLDLNESSMIELKPARKRPRMEDPAVENPEDFDVLGHKRDGIETMPVELDSNINLNQIVVDVDSGNNINIIGVDVSLAGGDMDRGIDTGFLIKDSQITLEDNEPLELSLPPLENGNNSKEDMEQLGKGLNIVKDDGDNNNDQSHGELEVSKFKSERKSETEEGKERSSDSNGGDHNTNDNGGGTIQNLGPGMESSPLTDSEKSDAPSREVNLSLKAFDPKTGKLVYEEPCIRSDYIRLEVFLNQHNLGVTQSSFNSGYLGDIDSEDHLFSIPQSTGYRKGRWTSSTLGSSIPRDSIKTVYTISPNGESPGENEVPESKKRGKNDPKLASTRLSDDQAFSGGIKLNKKVPVSNGDDSSSNVYTPSSKPQTTSKRRGSKSSKKSSTTSDTSTSSASKTSKKRASATLVDKTVNTSQQTTPAPKSRSSSITKEFSRLSGSPMPISTSTVAEPSPARAVAIVEGAAARPLTKFEQEVNNEEVDLGVLKHSKTLWGSIATNNPVFARWSDKNYYSGFIKEKGMNDTWIIDFDDATTYAASEGHIIPIKILGVGITGVYCPDSGYHPANATVLGQKFASDPDIGETVKYAIKLNDGENKGQVLWCTRRMLSIKENDARLLRQEYQPTFKTFKAAEVSLENIIPESSRRRVTTSLTKSSLTPQPSTPKTPTTARKIVGGAFDASTAGDDSHNESNQQTPKRKPKPKTPKKKSKGNESNVSTLSGNNSRSSRGSSLTLSSGESAVEKSLKESPKKTKILKDKPEHQVFIGYQFFLTASGGGDPASTSSNSGPQVPYDKDEYRDLIERKGGKIVDSVGQEEGKEKTFLVSDNYARTVKYIYSLAASIPCVSHKWIQECITNGKIVPWESYELNAGWSLETNKVIPPHKKKPLEGFEIYITAGSNDLYDYWKPVLTAADAKLLKAKKVKGKVVETDIPKDARVLVTDATCSSEILAIAHERMIPVVKPEWLVQSLIAGVRADFFNHEKYRVEMMETEEFSEDEYSDDDDNQS